MIIRTLTLFPKIYDMYLEQTILDRARKLNQIEYEIVDIRTYAESSRKMDDIVYGGGAGMLLKPEPYFKYFFELKNKGIKKPYTVFVSPQGKKVSQSVIEDLSKKDDILIISARYEGLDQRVIDRYVDLELCVGDIVLTNGDLPALSIIDAIVRQKDGVIKEESYETDSFYNGLLGYPQYTRPENLGRHKVPQVLLSGDHKKIEEYRFKESVKKTILNRPDLIEEKLKDEDFKRKVEKIL
ncbi:tRNA (guanosine(37)-N1)-methyltransferase TrmD [Oceanivirga miroungae]|uniref:tRNA (guanine-N(1)-)-methyltransferase n=1 Tax=Oceanivirga miroungae TaxID=1130046 RepID=A0A6I8MA50_9FUSO|nr:tRNA (guanosine(37)-N1)-methyltransferase TrmD [Oceanivirga miroungae]VWL85062.1 tRNA (guanine-N1)-methyltransferase [Oceanivirga miroungae]